MLIKDFFATDLEVVGLFLIIAAVDNDDDVCKLTSDVDFLSAGCTDGFSNITDVCDEHVVCCEDVD